MADFADGLTDECAGRRLACTIQGKGDLRRFKDALREEDPDLLPAWSAFRDTRARRRAMQWQTDNRLIDDGFVAFCESSDTGTSQNIAVLLGFSLSSLGARLSRASYRSGCPAASTGASAWTSAGTGRT